MERAVSLENYVKLYNEAIFDTDRDRALKIVRDAVEQGVTPEDVVFKIVLPAMDVMIKSVSENFDANLAQHFLTARIADIVTAEMIPKFKQMSEVVGQVVIGTAPGDFHTLGKRIVMGCLKARMIGVIDLGVNVPAERFVDEAVVHKAQLIGISALMVHTATGENGCRKVRRILQERELQDRIKIIVGGAPFRFDPQLYKTVQADAWAEDGITAGKVITDLVKEMQR
ncbi:MAG: cobalamin B12-binding domain-containing protein [Verrucomicrobia bacterium]|nr:cobalamin B12-binding domain-containing protein [Verrucomicrobiota bacterium]